MSLALSRFFRPFPNLLLSFPRRRDSSPVPRPLDSRLRGNDDRGGGETGPQPGTARHTTWGGDSAIESTRLSGGHSPWDG